MKNEKFYDYEVVFVETTSQKVRVMARNEEEAKERAKEAYKNGYYDKKDSEFIQWYDQDYEMNGSFDSDITCKTYDYTHHLPITKDQAKLLFDKAEVIKIIDDGGESIICSVDDVEEDYYYAIERSKFPELMDLLLEGVAK